MAKLLKSLLVFSLVVAAYAKKSSIRKKDSVGSFIHTKNIQYEDADPKDITSTYIVTMLKGTNQVLRAFSNKKITTFARRVGTLAHTLQSHAKVSQEPVHKYLKTIKDPNLEVRSLWAQNKIILRKAPADVILRLKTHFSHLLRVEPDSYFPLDDPLPSSSKILKASEINDSWGIKRIQAEEAVKLLLSTKSGPLPQIRVAIIDSGVRGTHEALRDNSLGEYRWFDPGYATEEPNDASGHGTHVMGTICGSKGVGVFPQANWMACKSCRTRTCAESSFLECAQWMMCPHHYDRTSPNCSLAAHIVSNSWSGGTDGFFDSSVEAWRAAGIIVVKSAGNNGPECSRLTYPAELEGLISVASTMSNDTISGFSSKGPTKDGRLKPDFTAPGSDVLSSIIESDNEYGFMSGTSMSCPHVAGLAALLLAYDETLGYDGIMEALKAGAETSTLTVPDEDLECGGIPSDVFPNNAFGHGLVNALRSLTYLIGKSKQQQIKIDLKSA